MVLNKWGLAHDLLVGTEGVELINVVANLVLGLVRVRMLGGVNQVLNVVRNTLSPVLLLCWQNTLSRSQVAL